MATDVKTRLTDRAAEAEKIVVKYLPEVLGMQRTIFEAMEYSIKAGGKRLRPVLMSETFKLFGGKGEAIDCFMAAIEMIHTYSLVHDDLPSMDNDMLRRGKPTTHAVYGEGMGVLAGIDRNIKALQILSKKAGVFGMIGGQVVDVESEKKHETMTEEKIDFIYELKTGALIEASMEIGAVLAGASEDEIKLIESVASKIGMAFQIQDDILDIEGDEAVLGKPIGSDERNEKSTYVTFKGIEKSKEEVKRLTDEAIDNLKKLPYENDFLMDLLQYLVYRDN